MTVHTGFRAVHGDLTSSHGYRWPYPGRIAHAPGPINKTNNGPCPVSVGDGLCIAKTWYGASSGGIPARTCLVVEWDSRDVLGEDTDKVRVRKAKVVEILDVPHLIRAGFFTGAYLAGADLTGADLAGADFTGADLTRANLIRANLAGADLAGANLSGANLTRAYLAGAYLARANLTGANLSGAYLAGAYLAGADLTRADLTRANLAGANLAGADLAGAYLTRADLTRANLALSDPIPAGWKRGTSGLLGRGS